MNYERTRANIERREGRIPYAYLDSLVVPTVGVGFNLQRPDARQRLEAVGANYDAIMAGQPLNDAQIDALLDADLHEVEADLQSLGGVKPEVQRF